jgi:hypothetical protein
MQLIISLFSNLIYEIFTINDGNYIVYLINNSILIKLINNNLYNNEYQFNSIYLL